MARSRNFQQSRGEERNTRDIDAYLVREGLRRKMQREDEREISRDLTGFRIELSERHPLLPRVKKIDTCFGRFEMISVGRVGAVSACLHPKPR